MAQGHPFASVSFAVLKYGMQSAFGDIIAVRVCKSNGK